jgi:phosphomevalonate decarboxylase
MKATARAHPIQGLVKYHGMRDEELRLPYHDSISLCTTPSASTTTVEFGAVDEDLIVIDGEEVEGRGLERVLQVVDHVRDLAGLDEAVRFESESNFPTNIGFGSSSSGFAAAAVAACEAAGLDLTREEMSAIARRGSSSAARAVTGAFSHLRTGLNDEDCRSERIPVPDEFEEDLRIVACEIPAFKHTEEAHKEAADSHMFEARMAHIHGQISEMRDGLRRADFDGVYGIAEEDSLSLAATTMTGPAAWVYWKPETLEVFETVRDLRREEDVPVYFSVDTGASVYLNTTRDYFDVVQEAIEDLGIDTRVWRLGGPARVLDESEALF